MTPIPEVYLEIFAPELHSERLDAWLHQPHVARWWGNPEQQLKKILQHPPGTHAIIVTDGTPVGYLCWQRPSQEELDAAGLTDLPEDLVDIDIMIGEPAFLGRGVGPRALTSLLTRLREEPLVSLAGLATSVSNKAAIRAYEKAGFHLFREFQDPESGLCRYMVLELRHAV